ncbi:DedA family protein [Aliigemmobacter aestuarii]|nr:DedA family protein [Gemmobacter aestuarii]
MQDLVFDLVERGGYAGVAFLMFLETVFPPIPSEVIMPVAGIVAASGGMTLTGVILAGTLGAMLGNTAWYFLARITGIDRFQPLILRHGRWLTIDWPDVERAQAAFGRFGGAIVFLGRMIPTIRSVISIPAGILRMELGRFLIWSTVGTAIWSAGLAAAGWAAGLHFDRIEAVMGPVSLAVILAIAALYVWRQLTWTRKRTQGRP